MPNLFVSIPPYKWGCGEKLSSFKKVGFHLGQQEDSKVKTNTFRRREGFLDACLTTRVTTRTTNHNATSRAPGSIPNPRFPADISSSCISASWQTQGSTRKHRIIWSINNNRVYMSTIQNWGRCNLHKHLKKATYSYENGWEAYWSALWCLFLVKRPQDGGQTTSDNDNGKRVGLGPIEGNHSSGCADGSEQRCGA